VRGSAIYVDGPRALATTRTPAHQGRQAQANDRVNNVRKNKRTDDAHLRRLSAWRQIDQCHAQSIAGEVLTKDMF
jgi:hypothetical protein